MAKENSGKLFLALMLALVCVLFAAAAVSCQDSDTESLTTSSTSSSKTDNQNDISTTNTSVAYRDPDQSGTEDNTTEEAVTDAPTTDIITVTQSISTDTEEITTQMPSTSNPPVKIPDISSTNARTWIVDCNESVSLRKEPSFSAKTITGIKKGTAVTLIEFTERFAYVQYDKKNSSGKITKSYKGYVVAAYLVLPEEYSYKNELDTVEPVGKYTYQQMQEDLAAMSEKYPSLLSISSIGKSEEGRDLTLAILGNPQAENKIFVQASIHAREHMTTTLVMAQIDYMLTHQSYLYADTGMTVSDLLEITCFHIVPMSNPDGVNIVQTGILPEEFKGKYSSYEITQWKANAKGIDLNSNFAGDWENHGDGSVTEPGPYDYKGTAPECAAESKALADYVRANDFDLTLSYHTTGSIIYYNYGDRDEVNEKNLELANMIYEISGYTPLYQPSESSAGLKDWAIDKLGIPSLTIEFGSFNNPLMEREFSNIWARGRDSLIISAYWQSLQ